MRLLQPIVQRYPCGRRFAESCVIFVAGAAVGAGLILMLHAYLNF